MSDRATIGLDNPVFRGRLRQPERLRSAPPTRARYRPPAPRKDTINDVRAVQPTPQPVVSIEQSVFSQAPPVAAAVEQPPLPLTIVQPQPYAEPAQPRQRSSKVLKRPAVHFPRRYNQNVAPNEPDQPNKKTRSYTKLQLAVAGMAVVVFVVGIAASWQTIKTNHDATAQVAALSQKTNSSATAGGAVVPSTTKPTTSTLSDYVVAPNLPRYLIIPKLGVDTRVLQVGLTSTGALGTPDNVFDTAWYTGSAEPGQAGATLIDGHVSSWTSHGVFYGLNTLELGDTIKIVRGDGTVFNYQVMKTQVYSAGDVNMQAAITPVTPGVPGLNLISCTGDVMPGTSLFNERIIVFAKQI